MRYVDISGIEFLPSSIQCSKILKNIDITGPWFPPTKNPRINLFLVDKPPIKLVTSFISGNHASLMGLKLSTKLTFTKNTN